MKSFLMHFAFFLSLFIFISCNKEVQIPSAAQPPAATWDTIRHREFIFPDLKWIIEFDDFFGEQVFISTPMRPGFFNLYNPIDEVYFQPDSSSARTWANFFYNCDVYPETFWYYIHYPTSQVRIVSCSSDPQLVGKQASIIVKFQ